MAAILRRKEPSRMVPWGKLFQVSSLLTAEEINTLDSCLSLPLLCDDRKLDFVYSGTLGTGLLSSLDDDMKHSTWWLCNHTQKMWERLVGPHSRFSVRIYSLLPYTNIVPLPWSYGLRSWLCWVSRLLIDPASPYKLWCGNMTLAGLVRTRIWRGL